MGADRFPIGFIPVLESVGVGGVAFGNRLVVLFLLLGDGIFSYIDSDMKDALMAWFSEPTESSSGWEEAALFAVSCSSISPSLLSNSTTVRSYQRL